MISLTIWPPKYRMICLHLEGNGTLRKTHAPARAAHRKQNDERLTDGFGTHVGLSPRLSLSISSALSLQNVSRLSVLTLPLEPTS